MGLRDRARSWFGTPTPIAEAAPAAPNAPAAPAHLTRAGFDAGVPRGGTTEWRQTTAAGDRAGRMRDLYAAYVTCPWASAGVGAIVRTVTAGGLQVKWDQDDDEGDLGQPDEPAEVGALRGLLAWCNPTQDVIQVLSTALTDLLVYGDAFIEVTWLGGIPIALWNLDAPSMTPVADEHGTVTSYVQMTEQSQRAEFDLHEVIHVSLNDSASGVFGVSPVAKAELPITAWLWTAATLKETFRKGNPRDIHVDFPQSQETDALRWSGQYMVNNVGPRNIGNPVVTVRGGVVKELHDSRIEEYLRAKDQLRDEILSTLGVPPAKAGVIESGNLGGGTGESQDRALDLATPIPTPSGWTTMGALQVGDEVLDEAGRPCRVLTTYDIPMAESWRVHFSDDTHIDACSDHLWVTWTEKDRNAFGRSTRTDGTALPENWPAWRSERGFGPRVRRTAEIVDTVESRPKSGWYNHSIPMAGALDLPDADLPIPPYTLGAWLGDGTSVFGDITCTDQDAQVIEEIRAEGFTAWERESVRRSGRAPLYHVRGLMPALKAARILGNKHVPAEYLRGSAAQRLALLQGLMDTDGGFSSGQQVLFRNTNERLADAVLELARSLGQRAVKTKGRSQLVGVKGQRKPESRIDYGPSYAVTWTPSIQVFRIPRKVEKWKPSTKRGMSLFHRSIIKVEKIDDRPMKCIRVGSPNAMYLAGEGMIPTHNTFMVTTCAHPAGLLLEKLNYHIVRLGFGIAEWRLAFGEVDWRDSKTIEDIRDMRLRNGSWTLNRYRDEIEEPPVDGGDQPVLVDRQNIVLWSQMADLSTAMIASKTPAAKTPAPAPADGATPPEPDSAPAGSEPAKDATAPAEAHAPSVWAERYRAVRAAMEETR